jgi:hypothetical protein
MRYNKKSNKPYILEIKKFKENEKMLYKKSLLEYKSKFSPLSGSELKYNPEIWNGDSSIKESHNCYTYALGKIVKKLKSKGGTMTAAQKKLAYTPTYSDSYYLQLADALFEAFNHVGTNDTVVKNTMAQLKKRLDVLKLIEAYGVRQTLIFGLKDGAPSNLIGHLVSENAVEAANAGLKVNKVFYTF